MPVRTSVTIMPTAGSAVDIVPHGEVDLDTAYQIRDAVDRVLLDRPGEIRIDLREVTLIDSVGIGTLVGCYHAAVACRVTLRVTHPTRTVHRQLWVAGLIGLFGSPSPVPDPTPRPPEW